tara:strand:+ start:725 stop:1846 length:1122 start_codon:yes stop_codon:yes gene_type:complete
MAAAPTNTSPIRSSTAGGTRGAYITLDASDKVLSTDSVTAAMWSDNTPTLQVFQTSSAQVTSAVKEYYTSVFQTASTGVTAAIQFDIAYANSKGSGSVPLNPLVVGTTPTRINYGSYRNLILGDENATFIFGNYSASDFYCLPIERARYKQSILPGTWTLNISGSGANNELRLTDDSKINTVAQFSDAGRYYNIISGSAGVVTPGGATSAMDANGWTIASGSYGWVIPDASMLLLNAAALDGATADGGIALGTETSNGTWDDNSAKVVNALAVAGKFASATKGFTLNSKEDLSSDFIFCRAKSQEYNYSSNPSFISSSTGAILFDSFIDNPTTYITTVGLYNQSQELLAVAKLSRPLEKDFTKELLVRVKLDF